MKKQILMKIAAVIGLSGGIIATAVSLGAWSVNLNNDQNFHKLASAINQNNPYIESVSGLPTGTVNQIVTTSEGTTYIESDTNSPENSKNINKSIILYKQQNDTVFRNVTDLPDNGIIQDLISDHSNNVYAVVKTADNNYSVWHNIAVNKFAQITLPDSAKITTKSPTIAVNLNNTLYINTDEGLYYTTNQGKLIKPCTGIISNIQAIYTPNFGGTYIVVKNSNNNIVISASTKDDSRFKQISGEDDFAYTENITALAIDNNQTVYVGGIQNDTVAIWTKKLGDESGFSPYIYSSSKGNNSNVSTPITHSDVVDKKVISITISDKNDVYIGTKGIGIWYIENGDSNEKKTITLIDSGGKLDKASVVNKNSITISQINKKIYIGTEKNGLWYTDQGHPFSFIQAKDVDNQLTANTDATPITVIHENLDGSLYIGADNKPLLHRESLYSMIGLNFPDYFGNEKIIGYGGWLYNQEQTINIGFAALESIDVDGHILTSKTTLKPGKHTLTLKFNDSYSEITKQMLGIDSDKTQSYNIWIKTSISDDNINYEFAPESTGFNDITSSSGNTAGKKVIQAEVPKTDRNAAKGIIFNITDKTINLHDSYYIKGTVNQNNFKTGSSPKVEIKGTGNEITDPGIYKLVVVDWIDNTYTSYLEIGEENWKISGKLNNSELNQFGNQLNVTLDLNTDGANQARAKIRAKLEAYQSAFTQLEFKLLSDDTNTLGYPKEVMKALLDKEPQQTFFGKQTLASPEQKISYLFNNDNLVAAMKNIAQKLLSSDLKTISSKAQKLHVDMQNVNNKNVFNKFIVWITEYEQFIKQTHKLLASQLVYEASLGYSRTQDIDQFLSDKTDSMFESKYLKDFIWTQNTSNDFEVESDNYINYNLYVNSLTKNYQQSHNVVQQLHDDIEKAKEYAGVSDSEYNKILKYKNAIEPVNKIQIDEYNNQQSFGEWLKQAKADYDGHMTNIKNRNIGLGVGIGVGGFLIIVGTLGYVYYIRNHKHKTTVYYDKVKK